ncbi:hypothetical protein D770_12210 [Flammeovirgaceae bacterium 311]|nr:hypothetical protein D770_12210 [Flammeovirgaceae bacterium 311]
MFLYKIKAQYSLFMKKLLSLLFFCSFFVIITFLLFLDFEQQVGEWLSSPESLVGYAALSFVLLMSDILLPVPSSLIMILNGKVLGLLWGTVLSLVSGIVSSTIGFYGGRKSAKVLNSLFSSKELEAGNKLFMRFGTFGIALSKALPVLSESLSFVAGTTAVNFRTFLTYSFIGQSVVSFLYAYTGGLTVEMDSNFVAAAIIGLTLLLSWLLQWLVKPEDASPTPKGKHSKPSVAAGHSSK